jgi:hypothetical protein
MPDIARGRDDLIDSTLLLDEIEAVTGFHAQALPHVLRDGDLAFARKGGARHFLTFGRIPYFIVRLA